MYFNDLLIALLTIKTENCKQRPDSKVEDEHSTSCGSVSSLVSVLLIFVQCFMSDIRNILLRKVLKIEPNVQTIDK